MGVKSEGRMAVSFGEATVRRGGADHIDRRSKDKSQLDGRLAAMSLQASGEVRALAPASAGCDWPPHTGRGRKPVTTHGYIWY